jgi:hypothetical protein
VRSVTDDRVPGAAQQDDPSRPAWFLPSIADFVFIIIVLLALRLGQTELLNDPGTGWHVRVGRQVWDTGPPHVDQFSYTRAGEPWISQHWLCDAVLEPIYRRWSWNGLVAVAALLLGWTYRALFRTVLDAPANVAWAAVLTLLAAGCGAPHWLARPHLVSMLFLLLVFRWCWDFHRAGSRSVWMIPAVMVLWCNIHGAFIAGLVVVGCSLVGQALSVPRDAVWRGRIGGSATVLVLSLVATLVNPYGWKLHSHLANILFSAQVRDLIDEWRAPDFQLAETRPLEILLLLSLLLLAVGRPRPNLFSLVHLIVWIHFALTSVRQVVFLGLIATPLLGSLTRGLGEAVGSLLGPGRWLKWLREVGRRADEWTSAECGMRWPVWSVAASVLLVAATVLNVSVPALGIGTARVSPERFPIDAVNRLNNESSTGPLFHDLNWGGYIMLMAYPPRAVFADDRFELYGRRFLDEYLDALNHGPSWSRLMARYEFQHVLIPPTVPLARALGESTDWEEVWQEDTAILLRRRAN